MKLGRDLSRQAQERGAREVAARCAAEVACPRCEATCRVKVKLIDICQAQGIASQERVPDDALNKPITDAIRYLETTAPVWTTLGTGSWVYR